MHFQKIILTSPREKVVFFGSIGASSGFVYTILPVWQPILTLLGHMAQSFPTSAQIIYETLSSDTDFTDLLGTYTFKAGQELMAISVVSPGQDLPAIRNVQGLECVIQDVGDTEQQLYYNEVDTITTWNVFLISWEPSTGADMQLAVNRALKRFLGAESIETIATADGIGSLVQTKIFIKSNMPILPA